MPTPPAPSTWKVEDLRFPKTLDDDPRVPALVALLKASCRKLWEGGTIQAPVLPWNERLAAALANAQRQRHLIQGIERAERALDREAHGISLVDARSGEARGSRVSRLLLTSNDGTERFYRQVERLLRSQGSRLLVIRLDAEASQLGAVMGAPDGLARALLVEHKLSVASVLLAWCEEGD